MKFYKKWLQKYIKEELPDDKKIEEMVTFNAFEVEEVMKIEGDTIFDIKVLPNRAHDALCHRGMAREISSLFSLTFVDPFDYFSEEGNTDVEAPEITIEDEKACPLFMSVRVDGIKVEESKGEVKEFLEAIGQRSINNIVDITNFVQFAINKPMHAYDANLISGNTLGARFARAGETLTTLDDKELCLDEQTLVIADKEKPLGLAGIKGGKFSGVSHSTTSLIIESANFNGGLIRKTSQKYGIRTDASKRFENEIADSLVEEGLRMTVALIKNLFPEAKVGALVKAGRETAWKYVASVSLNEVNTFLGTNYSADNVEETLHRLAFPYKKATLTQMIKERMKEVETAHYKNPSSMRLDAPISFSCSSLMSFLFNGIWQPSISIDKYVYGEKVDEAELMFGDLIFSDTNTGRIYYESIEYKKGTKVSEGIDHVGMYVGEGKVFHITREADKALVEDIATSKSFAGKKLYARMHDVEEERFFVTAPSERLDIRIKEDVIEEIARTMGLSSIQGVLPDLGGRKGLQHKRLFYETKIKNIFFAHGFSEIYTYTFGDKGEVAIVRALMDKKKLRTSLVDGIWEALLMNLRNAPLLGEKEIKVFEFGNVFTKDKEIRKLSIGVSSLLKSEEKNSHRILCDIFTRIRHDLFPNLESDVFGFDQYTGSSVPIMFSGENIGSYNNNIGEIDFDKLLEQLPEPTDRVFLSNDIKEKGINAVYSPISPYPFIVRDIAVWVPKEVSFESLKSEVEKVLEDDMKMLARPISLFDEFTKDTRTSYAFRLVIQSHEKTLTDEEANKVSNKVYVYLKDKGYEVR